MKMSGLKLFVWGTGVMLTALTGFAAEPSTNSNVLAWIRFADAPKEYLGTRYLWLGDGEMQLSVSVKPGAGHVIELLWGAKKDAREAVLTINGRTLLLKEGGYDGFKWLRVPVPAEVSGDTYELGLKAGQGREAFLAEVRLVGIGGAEAKPVDTSAARHNMSLKRPASWARGVGQGEAFPEMRELWDRAPKRAAAGGPDESHWLGAERNARLAAEGLYRCNRFVQGWLQHADPATGLIPRNLGEGRDYWNGRDSGADNYPFMVLTAAFTDTNLMHGRLLDILRTETRLTCRIDRLPDDYSFSKKAWRREKADLDAMIFDGAEYVKDGLLSVTEWLGPSPWSERMIGIVEDIWKHAPIETPFGKIPTHNFEVNGDLLQACSRIYWFTGDQKYLDWAIRLGDYYLLGTNHPTRDMKELRLMDHGCEVINGLSELYVAVNHARPEKKKAYEKPLHELFDRILEVGRNEDGLLYTVFNKEGGHGNGLCDTWGYNYDGFYAMYLVDTKEAYREAVRKALNNLKGKYVGAAWADRSADGFADSIEGALNLYNREPVASAADWIDSQIRMMWGIQKSDGIIEGWHGDGNSARTTLMYVLWKTQGVRVEPWRADVRLGAVRVGNAVYLSLASDTPWSGRVIFDKARHKLNMRLPMDYPRINQFPEWFTTEAAQQYKLENISAGEARNITGRALQDGVSITLEPSREQRWRISDIKQ